MNIPEILAHHEMVLHKWLSQVEMPAERLREAILYSLFPGGKRLRPILVYLCGALLNINMTTLDSIAMAIELIHCYSLVHDDLPSMDNDDFRRGKPSCHKAFDEATAILVGDALQLLAVDILLTSIPKESGLEVTKALVKASGVSGMISGQSLDITLLSQPSVTEAQLRQIHQLKTGKLISACINMVLAASDASSEKVLALKGFSRYFGLAFQMRDDYLDQYDLNNRLGKGRASDKANHKITFATLYSEPQLSELIRQTTRSSLDALEGFGERAENLRKFTKEQLTPT